jgi:hypothetical protein
MGRVLAPGVGLPAYVVPSFVVCSLRIGLVEEVYCVLVGNACSLILWACKGVDFVWDPWGDMPLWTWIEIVVSGVRRLHRDCDSPIGSVWNPFPNEVSIVDGWILSVAGILVEDVVCALLDSLNDVLSFSVATVEALLTLVESVVPIVDVLGVVVEATELVGVVSVAASAVVAVAVAVAVAVVVAPSC